MTATHPDERRREGLAQRLNWLRAGVLGANDGIVSTAAVVVGAASWIGGAARGRAIARTVAGGALALAATYLVGMFFGTVTG